MCCYICCVNILFDIFPVLLSGKYMRPIPPPPETPLSFPTGALTPRYSPAD